MCQAEHQKIYLRCFYIMYSTVRTFARISMKCYLVSLICRWGDNVSLVYTFWLHYHHHFVEEVHWWRYCTFIPIPAVPYMYITVIHRLTHIKITLRAIVHLPAIYLLTWKPVCLNSYLSWWVLFSKTQIILNQFLFSYHSPFAVTFS